MELIFRILVKVVCYFIVLKYLAKRQIVGIKLRYWEYKHKDFLKDISREKAIEEMKEDIEKERSFVRIPDASYVTSASAINAARGMMATNSTAYINQRMAEARLSSEYGQASYQQMQHELLRNASYQERQFGLQRRLASQQSMTGLGLQQQLGSQLSPGLSAYFGGRVDDQSDYDRYDQLVKFFRY